MLHPGVLEELDEPHLGGGELLGAQGGRGVDHVGRAMGRGGPVGLQAGDAPIGVEGVRQVDLEVLDEGLEAQAGLVVARGGPHEEGPRPQGAEIEVELALVVHEQGAAPLLLQHRPGGLGLEAEIGHLAVQVPGMGLGTPEGPATQSAQGELAQELIHVLHHGAQAPGGLAGQQVQQAEITPQHLGVPQPAGGEGHVAHDQGEYGAGGVGGELHQGAHQIRDHVLPHLLGHRRGLLHIGEDQVLTPVQAAHGLHAGEVVLQTPGRHDPGGLLIAGFQGLLVGMLRLGLEAGDVFAEVDGHGFE